jgi:hypothetical protein
MLIFDQEQIMKMKTRLMGFARQSQRRARTQARRLGAILKQYDADPVRNFSLRGEAAALARRVSGNWRQSEVIDRVILTDRGERRQVFLNHGRKSA